MLLYVSYTILLVNYQKYHRLIVFKQQKFVSHSSRRWKFDPGISMIRLWWEPYAGLQ